MLDEIKRNSTEAKRSRDLCIVSLALSTGLRVSAITQINIDDIDFTNYSINVVEKGNKVRTINFGENLASLICQCINDREKYWIDKYNALEKGYNIDWVPYKRKIKKITNRKKIGYRKRS